MSVVSTNAEAVKHRFPMGVCATVPHLPYIYCPIHSSKLAWYHSVITYSDLPLIQFTFECNYIGICMIVCLSVDMPATSNPIMHHNCSQAVSLLPI